MVVRDIILSIAVFGAMFFGFFVMNSLDKFLDENRKRIYKEEKKKRAEEKKKELSGDMTDEAPIKNSRTYKKQRGDLYQYEDEPHNELFDGKQ